MRACKRGVALWWLSSAMGARLHVFKHMRGVYFNENNIQIRIQTQNYELFVEVFQGLKFLHRASFIFLGIHVLEAVSKRVYISVRRLDA